MKNHRGDYNEIVGNLYYERWTNKNGESIQSGIKTITFQVTEDCSLRCTYCYQPCKKPNYMEFDVAKKFIDYIFGNRKNDEAAINENNTVGLVIDFIGGEPFLNVKLIHQICDYFELKFLENPDCPWGLMHRYSISTNGVAYFEKDVQNFIKEYNGLLSVGVTVDGCKELHDKCRLFPDGSPSYDKAIKAALDRLNFGEGGTKITQSPDNIMYTFEGIKNMIELGFDDISINPAFEEGWTINDAKILYEELKKLSDWLIENNLQEEVFIKLFDPWNYHNDYKTGGNDNWCGSSCAMFALDYKGNIYPCIRFMESSLNGEAEPYIIGDIETGIANKEEYKNKKDLLYSLTKDNQSEQKCLDCPIEAGCSWCTGYNYQHFGSLCHRATFICHQHKAAALGSMYFYKKCKDKENYNRINMTKEIALEIISEAEWDELQWEE